MKIYLIRHGETTSDVEDRYGGDYDDHLTEKGKQEVGDLAKKIKSFGIQMIFASPKVRAQETAEILSKKLDVPTETIVGIRERNLYGVLTAMKKSDAKEKYPELVERLKNTQDTIEAAEPWEDFVDRVLTAFKEISKSNYNVVVVVSHGGPIRRIFAGLLGIKREMGGMKIDDCAFAEIEVEGGKFKLVKSEGIYY